MLKLTVVAMIHVCEALLCVTLYYMSKFIKGQSVNLLQGLQMKISFRLTLLQFSQW